MSDAQRKIRLGAFISGPGHHVAAWRHPESQADGRFNFQHLKDVTLLAERGLFDAVFLADGLSSQRVSGAEGRMSYGGGFEPVTLFSALSAVTQHIGFIATASTTYEDPYILARKFASLDLLSGGRAAWNVVTTGNAEAAGNFGLEAHPNHALRYERAREFVEVVRGLWDSWEDDAFLLDKRSGNFLDPSKVHVLNHEGKYLRVRGPLNVPRPIQGHPVIVQAGASDDGRELAAQTAEVIFTAWQNLADAQSFYRDVKGRMAKYGRHPDELKVMPGVFPVIGRTESEAKEKFQELQELILPEVGLALLSGLVGGFDLQRYPLDGPLPELPDTNNNKSRQALMRGLAQQGLTIRELYLAIAGARGHWQLVGTPAQIADELQSWFENDAADGFNVMPPIQPTSLRDFVDLIVPELQRRGLYRTAYEGRTLRENLGLARPHNRFVIRKPESDGQAAE